MDLLALQSLVTTIREGSFSAAARALGVPKSTVAQRVNLLEDKLGARLLERTTRRIRPTEEGTALFRRGEQLLAEADDLERSFREQSGKPRGTLRTSVPVLFEQQFMGAIAAAYLARYPDVRIEVVPDDRRVDIIGEGFDCAIRTGPLDDSSAIARIFAHARNIVVAAPSLVARFGHPSTLSNLSHWPAIWVGRDTPGEKGWDLVDTGQPARVAVSPHIFLGSLSAAHTAVLNGTGAALLPDFFVSDDLEAGRLICISSRWHTPRIPLSIVFPAHRQSSPRLRAFIDLVSEHFKCRGMSG